MKIVGFVPRTMHRLLVSDIFADKLEGEKLLAYDDLRGKGMVISN